MICLIGTGYHISTAMIKPAPILVSVYNRGNHLAKCVDSLLVNAEAINTDLYIVSDAAYRDEDIQQIKMVREYISRIQGFRRVIPIIRAENYGSFRSVKEALDTIFAEDSRVIFLEDDNVVAPNFLRFINEGLDFYESNRSIFSISGYHFPITIPTDYKYDVYCWSGFSAWGVGLWRDRWESLDWTFKDFSLAMRDRKQRRDLDDLGEHLRDMIESCLKHQRKIIDVAVCYNLFLSRMHSIFPVVSKVRNIGHDGSGEHCGTSTLFADQIIDTGSPFIFPINLKPDPSIYQAMRKYHSISWKAKTIHTVKNVLSEKQFRSLKGVLERIIH